MAAYEGRPPASRAEVYRRFSDLDLQGHVNNVAYYDYLQEARLALMLDLDQAMGDLYNQVVVKQDLRYRKSLKLSPEPVIIETWVERLGNTSYTVTYVIIDEEGDIAADGSSVIAVVDPTTGRPTRIHAELRAVLEPLTIAP